MFHFPDTTSGQSVKDYYVNHVCRKLVQFSLKIREENQCCSQQGRDSGLFSHPPLISMETGVNTGKASGKEMFE